MPASKDIRRFTEKWLELFDWFEEHPELDHIVQVETPSQARSMRFEFYRARTAMYQDPGLRELYPQANRRGVYLDGNTVAFRVKDHTPLADLLKQSLTQQGAE